MSAWDPITQPCDYVLFAGQKTPGIAEVVGASSPRDWDVKKGYGIAGAFSIFTGRNLSKFSVKIRLYTSADWADWYAFKPLVDKMPKRRLGAGGRDSGMIDIWHPFLDALDIRAVGVVEIMQPEQTDDGEFTIDLKLIEFRRPKIALAKPEGPASPTPVDPIEENWIKPLTEQFQRLAEEP